jgi:toxin-antitoxin system PIN domain toxin
LIAVDTNLLVYAHRADSAWHERARAAIRKLAEDRSRWAIPWPCVHEFLSVVTHPKIYQPASSLEQAIDQVEAWSESPSLSWLAEGDGYWHELRQAIVPARVVGPRIHDARIAALCSLHNVRELWTQDRDFSRFPDLRTRNPLVE